MKPSSVRARESIKTGLAMVITYGIAMQMDFLEPLWGGFAVAMVSLDTAGQSLNKAAMRMFGTLVALVASLAFMGLFPQQRWGMLLCMSVYVGFCTYMLAGKKRQYFWFVTAFVCLTIMVHGGADSENMFRFAVARVEETVLGILVYSLIGVLLWPRNSRGDLDTASRALFDSQLGLYRAYRGLLAGRGRDGDSRPLRLQMVQQLGQLARALNAAETDTYEVWEVRHSWRRFVQHSNVLAESLGRWRTSMPEVRPLDLGRLLPGLEAFLAEVDRRFVQIEGVLAGRRAEAPPRSADLARAEAEIHGLSHFQKGALALFLAQLRQLDEISRSLFDCVVEIKGSGRIATPRLPEDARPRRLALDPDRLRSVVTVLATLWIGYLIWIWLDPPGHASFWFQSTLWAMVAAMAGQSIVLLAPAFLLSIVVGGFVYVGLMPHLSGFAGLGLVLFVGTAGGFYALWNQRGARAVYAALLIVLMSVDNQQTYSFASFANTAAMILLTLALTSAVAYFPSSPRPEKVFLRLLARFFRHGEILMSELAPDAERRKGLAAGWRRAWYRGDLLEIPQKLVALVDRIDYRLLPGATPEQVRALVTNLLALTMRIKELLDAREQAPPDPRIEQIVGDLRDWRLAAERQFRLWAADPSATSDSVEEIGERIHARLARMEANIEEARARAGEDGFHVDYEKLYRYLGALRGLSESGIAYARVTAGVNWEPWREARF